MDERPEGARFFDLFSRCEARLLHPVLLNPWAFLSTWSKMSYVPKWRTCVAFFTPGTSNPFRIAVPFRGQTTWILRGLSPKRDCGPKRIEQTSGMLNSVVPIHSARGYCLLQGAPAHLKPARTSIPVGRKNTLEPPSLATAVVTREARKKPRHTTPALILIV